MTLRELQHKFRTDTISTAELEELRRLMDDATDEELGEALAADWGDFRHEADAAAVEELRLAVEKRLAQLRRRRFVWRAAVAVVLLAVGAALSWVFVTPGQTRQFTDVATAAGGRSIITLPDGTVVDLDANSGIRYCTADFGAEERKLSFTGRAYFDVAKDPQHPFVIDADGVEVRVLGTTFNLDAVASANSVSLTLESGRVALKSNAGGATVEVLPGQEAIVNRLTGEVNVSEVGGSNIATAWRRNELVFDCASLQQVCASFKRTYGMEVEVGDASDIVDTFSGTLPTDNVIEAVDIICRAYGLQSDFYTTGKVVLKK